MDECKGGTRATWLKAAFFITPMRDLDKENSSNHFPYKLSEYDAHGPVDVKI